MYTLGPRKNNQDEMIRNSYQWLAMLSMFIDHIAFLFSIPFLRFFTRVGFPLYALLFVYSLKNNQVKNWRLFLLACISQIPYSVLFPDRLNIIFGFWFFSLFVASIRKRKYFRLLPLLMTFIFPVDYGLYLYATLGGFYLCSGFSRSVVFMVVTFIYSFSTGCFMQLGALFAVWKKQIPHFSRPPKFLYRYFYPLHLAYLALIKIVFFSLLLVCCGCQELEPRDDVERFQSVYAELSEVDIYQPEKESESGLYTFVANDIELKYFFRWLSDEAGISVITSPGIETKTLSCNIQNQSVADILDVVARRFGVQIIRNGSLYYLGQLRPEDRGIMVRMVKRMSKLELSQAVESLLSEHGRFSAYADGLLVVADRVQVLNKVSEMIDLIEENQPHTWVVQLYVLSGRSSDFKSFGFDTNLQAEVSYNLFKGDFSADRSQFQLAFDALMSLERSKQSIDMIAKPLFVLCDGSSSVFHSGEQYPVAKKTVSDSGTITTTGYDFIPVGLQFKIGLREITQTTAKLNLKVEMSNVVGFVEEVPITDNQTFTTEAVCQMSGVYLLGSIKRSTTDHSKNGFLQLQQTDNNVDSIVQVWAKIYRIDSPVFNQKQMLSVNPSETTDIPPGPALDGVSDSVQVFGGQDSTTLLNDSPAGLPEAFDLESLTPVYDEQENLWRFKKD